MHLGVGFFKGREAEARSFVPSTALQRYTLFVILSPEQNLDREMIKEGRFLRLMQGAECEMRPYALAISGA